jgi:hypothetical protein
MSKSVTIQWEIAMRSGRSAVAMAIAGIYLALSLAASTCLFLHSTTHHSESHHSESDTHSPLCAWACQVNSEGGLVTASPVEMSGLVTITSVTPHAEPLSAYPSPSLHSRAPPVSTLG